MAGWYKQHTSELASLEAFAQCGRAELVTAWLRVTRWTVDNESDDLPASLEADAAALEAVGLRTTFAARCKKLLDQREAMASKRELKRAQVNSSELTSVHVSSSDHQDKTRLDKTTEKKNAAPPVPRYALSKAACLQAWNDAVHEVTGMPSCVTGMAESTRAQDFHKIVYGNGETFADVVRRRVATQSKLTLHWCMNDYAEDRRRAVVAQPAAPQVMPALRMPEGTRRMLERQKAGGQ